MGDRLGASVEIRPFWCAPRLVEGAGLEHGVDDVAAAACKADDGGIVLLILGAFALVVGGRFWVAVRCHPRGPEQGVLELFVPRAGWVFAAD